jgi:hypothetical protein
MDEDFVIHPFALRLSPLVRFLCGRSRRPVVSKAF